MKINFDSYQSSMQSTEISKNHQMSAGKTTHNADAFSLNISSKQSGMNAYSTQGKSKEDIMKQMSEKDVKLMRDYLTVMSNSMSSADFEAFSKNGYDPADMDPKEAVTIIDQIKAAMIKGGAIIEGYTTDIDQSVLENITGSEVFANELQQAFQENEVAISKDNLEDIENAYNLAQNLEDLSDGAKKFMVENEIEPTIDGIYQAEHKSLINSDRQSQGYFTNDIAGYYAKKAEGYDWEQLSGQLKQVIKDASLPIDDDTMGEAKWLVEKGIPVTADALMRIHQLNEILMPLNGVEVIKAISNAIADGKNATEANLWDGRSDLQKAVDYQNFVQNITEEMVDCVVSEGQKLTIRNLQALNQGSIDVTNSPNEQQLQARRVLAEVQLSMTVEANLKLLRSDYAIDTSELEQLVDVLKEAEKQILRETWKSEDDVENAHNQELFEQTRQVISRVPQLPAETLGRYTIKDANFTMSNLAKQGDALQTKYEAAREDYEKLMTAPRGDLGDSIKKAFRNAQDILTDMGIKATDSNLRAIRILGYNHIEITEENLWNVKAADMQLREVMSKLTPAATLQAIRDGVNPLELNLVELNQYLDSKDESRETQQLGKFLYRLEQNNELTESEKEGCIGIYRMLRQLERTEDAAIGKVLESGQEMSFQNLLTAMRSSNKKGMDYKIDDQFGAIEGRHVAPSISEQINQAYHVPYAEQKIAFYESVERQILSQITPEKVEYMAQKQEASITHLLESSDINIEHFLEEMSEAEVTDTLKALYDNEREMYQKLLQNKTSVEQSIHELENYELPVTLNQIVAMDGLRQMDGSLFKKIKELFDKEEASDEDNNLFWDDGQLDQFANADEPSAMYAEYMEHLDHMLSKQIDNQDQYIDVKALQTYHRQTSILTRKSSDEQYDIPVEMNGEITAVRVSFRHEKGVSGAVNLFFQTEKLGKVAARFLATSNESYSGYVMVEQNETADYIKSKAESFDDRFKDSWNVVQANHLDEAKFMAMPEQMTEQDMTESGQPISVTNKELYKIAIQFIKEMQEG